MVMWQKFMRFVPEGGIRAGDLRVAAGLSRDEWKWALTRMSRWWGYVAIDKSGAEAPSNWWMVRPTRGGALAVEIWRPLTGEIEERWRKRFGADAVGELCESLGPAADRLGAHLPDHLPVLGYWLLSGKPEMERTARGGRAKLPGEDSLPGLLSKMLLAFALAFESESGLSLAICANVLRLVGSEGVRMRDLPRCSGVAKEAIAMAVKRLEALGLATVSPEAAAGRRTKLLMLTEKGRRAREVYERLIWKIEQRWEASVGEATRKLRRQLEWLVTGPDQKALLFGGVEPYPDGWRAAMPKREMLPHFPMILHRGGFPDGS